MKRIAALLVSLCCAVPAVFAQQGGCEGPPGFSDFDFWIGSWDVTDFVTGRVAGSNRIEKIEAGCVVMEHWTGAAGGTGTSLNYLNPVTGQWRQLWVSAGRYAIDIAGGIESGAMVLTGQIFTYPDNSAVDFRGTWTPQEDGSVRQFFEQYNAGTDNWDTWFDGRYVRSTR